MPNLPKAKQRRKPKKKLSSDYSFYNSRPWRLYSKRNRGTCKVCEAQLLVVPAAVMDHIVPIQQGGSKWDKRNHMGMCHPHHNQKRGLESHGYCVASMEGHDGLIPQQRNDIIERLISNGDIAPKDDVWL